MIPTNFHYVILFLLKESNPEIAVMAGRVRINVKFGETKVLVPCGDGSITVNEMIEKAIDRFKKAKKLVSGMIHVCGQLPHGRF